MTPDDSVFGPSGGRDARGSDFDLNADLAEGYGRWSFGTDDDLLTIVSSANIACGFHAGDPSVIRHCLTLAAVNGVTIGAHVGYPDLGGFGRRAMDMSYDELRDAVLYQLAALEGLAKIEGLRVHYLKPHGALYHQVATDDVQAAALVDAMVLFDPTLVALGLRNTKFTDRASAAGLETRSEAFADRAYSPDGNLVGRSSPDAVLSDPDQISRRAVRMLTEGAVTAIDGSAVSIRAESLCVHGDSPRAIEIARATRAALEDAGLSLRSTFRRHVGEHRDPPGAGAGSR